MLTASTCRCKIAANEGRVRPGERAGMGERKGMRGRGRETLVFGGRESVSQANLKFSFLNYSRMIGNTSVSKVKLPRNAEKSEIKLPTWRSPIGCTAITPLHESVIRSLESALLRSKSKTRVSQCPNLANTSCHAFLPHVLKSIVLSG